MMVALSVEMSKSNQHPTGLDCAGATPEGNKNRPKLGLKSSRMRLEINPLECRLRAPEDLGLIATIG
jgi:hypothetical protein